MKTRCVVIAIGLLIVLVIGLCVQQIYKQTAGIKECEKLSGSCDYYFCYADKICPTDSCATLYLQKTQICLLKEREK